MVLPTDRVPGAAAAACAGTVSRGGEPFPIVKFHTVHLDAERRVEAMRAQHGPAGVLFRLCRDPWVTRPGRSLRGAC